MPERAALVTGASSGIGLAIAEVLGETGHGLTVAARRPDKLAGAVEQLREKGYEVEEVAANLTSEEDVRRVVAAHRARYGRLDVLVNSAGVGVGAAVADVQTKRVDMQLDLNLRAIVLFYRECADLLRAAGGEHRNAPVVNLSSISGKSGQPWLSVYSATKGRGDRLDAGDEQGAQRRRHQVGRTLPRLRGHADDRVHPSMSSPRT
jgi:NAD(P)-dependent dehydrogenase (short-subunit alcohol dehydrogenase family)